MPDGFYNVSTRNADDGRTMETISSVVGHGDTFPSHKSMRIYARRFYDSHALRLSLLRASAVQRVSRGYFSAVSQPVEIFVGYLNFDISMNFLARYE